MQVCEITDGNAEEVKVDYKERDIHTMTIWLCYTAIVLTVWTSYYSFLSQKIGCLNISVAVEQIFIPHR